VRRIAFEYNGLTFPEYDQDLLVETLADLPDLDEGKRNLVDLAEFAHTFKYEPEGVLEEIYPALITRTSASPMRSRCTNVLQTRLGRC
jgi:hypothetical protein